MAKPSDCRQCGAALQIPDDLAILHVRCHYCGTEQPLPDIEARTRAVRERAHSEQIRADVRANVRSARNFTRMMMLPGLIIGGIAMVAGLLPVLKMSFGGSFSSSWDGRAPFECGGNDEMKVSDVTANVSGTAIYASGNCQLSIENCRITATTAIESSGNAHVVIRGGTLTAPTLVNATENSTVDNRGARVNGKVKKQHNARVTGMPGL